jgi:hypothetical protein
MEPSEHDNIWLCKILFFVGGTELLAEWTRFGMHNRPENGRGARVALRTRPTFLILILIILIMCLYSSCGPWPPHTGRFVIYFRHLVGLLWTSDQPVAKASTYTGQHNT